MCVVYLYHCSGLFRFLVLSFHFKIFVFVLRKPRNWSTVTIPPCSLVTHPLCSPKYVRQQCVHTGSNALSQGTGSPLWAQSLSLSFFFFIIIHRPLNGQSYLELVWKMEKSNNNPFQYASVCPIIVVFVLHLCSTNQNLNERLLWKMSGYFQLYFI